jgi:hypothetical protein
MDGTGGFNVAIHDASESFPWHSSALAMHLLRFASLAMGAATVLATYRLGRLIFLQNEPLALIAAAINAFVPQFVFITAAVNNDALVIALSAWTLVVLVEIAPGSMRWRDFVALGVLLGLGALTKYSSLVLFLLAALVVLIAARKREARPVLARGTVIAFALAALIAGWWYARNVLLYGDPLGWGMWQSSYATAVRTIPLSGWYIGFLLDLLYRSFWATFGWMNVTVDGWLYAVFGAAALLALVGWVRFVLNKGDACIAITFGPDARIALAVLWLDVAVIAIGAAQFMLTFDGAGSQGRYLFPALPAIAILLVIGWQQFGEQWLPAFAAGFFVVAAACPWAYIAPAYALPAQLSQADIAAILHRADVNFGQQIRLLGFDVRPDDAPAPNPAHRSSMGAGASERVHPGDTVEVDLFWQAIADVRDDYRVFVHLLGPGDAMLGQIDRRPFEGRYPTDRWRTGESFRDSYRIRVAADAVTGPARVEVGFYRYPSMKRLPVVGDGDSVIITRIKIARLPSAGIKPAATPIIADLGGEIRLLGYALAPASPVPGETVRLKLVWQALTRPTTDYTVFVHLLDEQDHIVAQADSMPQNGEYPTSLWDATEVVSDEHTLSIPPGLAPGRYRLAVGMYLLATGKRLATGTPENRILIELEIGRPQ